MLPSRAISVTAAAKVKFARRRALPAGIQPASQMVAITSQRPGALADLLHLLFGNDPGSSHHGPAMMLHAEPTITCPFGPPMAWVMRRPLSRNVWDAAFPPPSCRHGSTWPVPAALPRGDRCTSRQSPAGTTPSPATSSRRRLQCCRSPEIQGPPGRGNVMRAPVADQPVANVAEGMPAHTDRARGKRSRGRGPSQRSQSTPGGSWAGRRGSRAAMG